MAPALPFLTGIPTDLRPVIIRLVHQPPQIIEHPHSLYEIRLALSQKTKICPHALARDRDIPPLSPHMCVPIAPYCPLILYELPCWNVRVTKVTEGKKIINLLNHLHLITEMSIHEVLT